VRASLRGCSGGEGWSALEAGEFEKAYPVLGGEGWTLRDFYTSGRLRKYLVNSDKVEVFRKGRDVVRARALQRVGLDSFRNEPGWRPPIAIRNRQFNPQSTIGNLQWMRAGVAELADARDLKSRGVTPVRVRIPPPAPQNAKHFGDYRV